MEAFQIIMAIQIIKAKPIMITIMIKDIQEEQLILINNTTTRMINTRVIQQTLTKTQTHIHNNNCINRYHKTTIKTLIINNTLTTITHIQIKIMITINMIKITTVATVIATPMFTLNTKMLPTFSTSNIIIINNPVLQPHPMPTTFHLQTSGSRRTTARAAVGLTLTSSVRTEA